MSRRLRREFQGLEAQLEPEVQAKQWRALIDQVLYNKGPGPKPIVEQLRLREKLRTLHARRDRYNFKRHTRRYEALLQLIKPRHVLAALAIRSGMVEPAEGACPRDLLIGALAGDRRLTRKFLEELETVYETIHPANPPWECDIMRIHAEMGSSAVSREDRKEFEQLLMPTPLPETTPAAIPFGYPKPLRVQPAARKPHAETAAASAA